MDVAGGGEQAGAFLDRERAEQAAVADDRLEQLGRLLQARGELVARGGRSTCAEGSRREERRACLRLGACSGDRHHDRRGTDHELHLEGPPLRPGLRRVRRASCARGRAALPGRGRRQARSAGRRRSEGDRRDPHRRAGEAARVRVARGDDDGRPGRILGRARREEVQRRPDRGRPLLRDRSAAEAEQEGEADPGCDHDAAALVAAGRERQRRRLAVLPAEPPLVPDPRALRRVVDLRASPNVQGPEADSRRAREGLRLRLAAGRCTRLGDDGLQRPLPDQLPQERLREDAALRVGDQLRARRRPGRLLQR